MLYTRDRPETVTGGKERGRESLLSMPPLLWPGPSWTPQRTLPARRCLRLRIGSCLLLEFDERRGELGPCGYRSVSRCSDKGLFTERLGSGEYQAVGSKRLEVRAVAGGEPRAGSQCDCGNAAIRETARTPAGGVEELGGLLRVSTGERLYGGE